MNKHVVTLNVGNWASPNAIASQRHAAERWGAEYHEFTKPWCAGTDPADVFAAKFDLGDLPFEQPCRVVWLDGDVIVRDDCPSLFDEVPVGTFGGVVNNQDAGELQDQVAHDYWLSVLSALPFDSGTLLAFNSHTYINGGVLVFDLPQHDVMFANSGKFWQRKPVNPMDEQTLLNIWLRLYGRRTWLPREFNCMGRDAWLSGPRMTTYIYHLANIGSLRGDKRARLDAIDWRACK